MHNSPTISAPGTINNFKKIYFTKKQELQQILRRNNLSEGNKKTNIIPYYHIAVLLLNKHNLAFELRSMNHKCHVHCNLHCHALIYI